MKKMNKSWFYPLLLFVLALATYVGVSLSINQPPVADVGIKVPKIAPYITQIGPTEIYPNPVLTPGEINRSITQDNISQNICNPRWSTRSIRPPSSYTTNLKVAQLKSGYNYQGDLKTADYEEDHFISLELGGSPTSTKNLWPEPYNVSIADGGARFKDRVENYLHSQVCKGTMTLQEAQKQISVDWYKVLKDQL